MKNSGTYPNIAKPLVAEILMGLRQEKHKGLLYGCVPICFLNHKLGQNHFDISLLGTFAYIAKMYEDKTELRSYEAKEAALARTTRSVVDKHWLDCLTMNPTHANTSM